MTAKCIRNVKLAIFLGICNLGALEASQELEKQETEEAYTELALQFTDILQGSVFDKWPSDSLIVENKILNKLELNFELSSLGEEKEFSRACSLSFDYGDYCDPRGLPADLNERRLLFLKLLRQNLEENFDLDAEEQKDFEATINTLETENSSDLSAVLGVKAAKDLLKENTAEWVSELSEELIENSIDFDTLQIKNLIIRLDFKDLNSEKKSSETAFWNAEQAVPLMTGSLAFAGIETLEDCCNE